MSSSAAPQISGIGAVSCVGIGADDLWGSAFEERTGISDFRFQKGRRRFVDQGATRVGGHDHVHGNYSEDGRDC